MVSTLKCGGLWPKRPLTRQFQGPSGTESVTLSGTAPGWEPPDDPDTGSECSHPEVSPSPRFVAAKTQTNQSGKKAPASVVRCATLLQRTPPATQTQTFRTPNSGSPASKATAAESAFSRRVEGKAQNHFEETNSSSQNSSEPYTCGACGIQFQFYNNLLEHMQSHAADNENNIASNQSRSPPAVVEEKWKPQAQRNSANNRSVLLTNQNVIPMKHLHVRISQHHQCVCKVKSGHPSSYQVLGVTGLPPDQAAVPGTLWSHSPQGSPHHTSDLLPSRAAAEHWALWARQLGCWGREETAYDHVQLDAVTLSWAFLPWSLSPMWLDSPRTAQMVPPQSLVKNRFRQDRH
ncbi:Zinc finger protein 618 [Tupaia chinensis]|uniref:Zinc finger protein 618 n=1 Tax=Tupaia chinensis TaxID=246437 RepID=L9L7J0_TUPCH|nr:Zinc finger protein 618 [Tupaia chinensis]